jgi:hypothetical protein
MNERIKELARESGLLVHNPNGVPTKLEKFAELIVEECMRMCEVAQVGYLTHGLEKEASGAFSVKQYIEEYLGVES